MPSSDDGGDLGLYVCDMSTINNDEDTSCSCSQKHSSISITSATPNYDGPQACI